MKYKVIVTLGKEELEDFKNPALQEADILEIRLDLLDLDFIKNNLSKILNELNKSLLFTYRNPKDSSEKSNTQIHYADISELLSEFNSDKNYLDIELDQEKSIFDPILDSAKFRIIYSYHDFKKSLSKEEMLDWISKKNRDNCIYKFAVMPQSIEDLEKFLKDLKEVSLHYPLIGIAMGKIGAFSRIFGDFFGSLATYCCVGTPRAPGQVDVFEFQKIRAAYKDKPLPNISNW